MHMAGTVPSESDSDDNLRGLGKFQALLGRLKYVERRLVRAFVV